MNTNMMIVKINIGANSSKEPKKRSSALFFVICFSFLLGFHSELHASNLEKAMDTYLTGDFQKTVEFLEQAVNEAREGYKAHKKGSLLSAQIELMTAYIYAWKLNEPDKALELIQKVIESKKREEDQKKMPYFEYLYLADI